ncbi:MAG: ATP-binding protein [Lachnospiraceae bacterium]|nr:ATP-binding protein [Lachnospiraceae bacterium]
MIAFLFQLTVNLIEYWILLLLMQYICAAHISLKRRSIWICSAVSVLLTATGMLLIPDGINFLISTVTSILAAVLLFSRKKFSDILRFFPAVAIYLVLTIVPEAILGEIMPAFNIVLRISVYEVSLISLVTDAVLFIILLFLRHFLIKYQFILHFRTREVIGCIALLFFSIIDIALIAWVNSRPFEPIHYVYLTIFIGAFLCSIIYYFYTLFASRVQLYRQSLSRNETEYLQLQLDSLQNVKENEEEVRKMRHDLNSHLAVMQSLCEEKNYEEVRKYAAQLSHDAIFSSGKILTGNHICDMIVSQKAAVCEEHGIAFTFDGSLANLKDMTAPDICGLLSNAYNNAIEACLPQQNTYIHTKVNSTRNYTVIQITNPVEKKVTVRSNRIPTTKADKKSHGYGIEIMSQIARKYGGSCSLHCSEKEFEVKIVLLG